ncbi:MAG: alpha/beta fold hydrolase [Acidobacteriota bacterium]
MQAILGLMVALSVPVADADEPAGAAVVDRIETVEFESSGSRLVGDLYLPDGVSATAPAPGVIVTGAWTTIKEQMPGLYAMKLAERGFVALAFDFRTWGDSEGASRSVEDPEAKIADIEAAARFLAGRADVSEVHGFGICASAGYVATAAERSDRLSRIALVAPWLHDAEIVRQVYGGDDGVRSLLGTAEQAAKAEAETGEPQLIPAAGPPGSDAIMAMDGYYTDPERGAVEAWENTFNLRSWSGWLTFDGVRAAPGIRQPTLIVHSAAAAIPDGARSFYAQLTAPRTQLWLDDVGQFDFYDRPDVVRTAVEAAVEHFRPEAALESARVVRAKSAEHARIETVLDLLASLVDRGDDGAVGRILADRVRLDYTSLWGGAPSTLDRDEVLASWGGLLPGFDATRHEFGDYQLEISGDRALATGNGTASHWLDQEVWTVGGRYRWTLERRDGLWRITGLTFDARHETGPRSLVARATERAASRAE